MAQTEIRSSAPFVLTLEDGKIQHSISVVVCTRNRPDALHSCLASVARTDYPLKELILVDSSDDAFTSQTIEQAQAYGFRYVYEPKPGLSTARNTAIQKSQSDIIAFTDDDCVVSPNWVRYLIRNFVDADTMCVTGRTIVSRKLSGGNEAYDRFMSQDKGRSRRVFSNASQGTGIISLLRTQARYMLYTTTLQNKAPIPWCMGVGSNMSFRKQVFGSVGFFDENLGVGTPQCGGEDVDMLYRIFCKGHRLIYDPEALVFHNHNHMSRRVFFDYGKGGGHFMVKHIRDPYIAAQYFARLQNVAYVILNTLLNKDKYGCYVQLRYLLGLISAMGRSKIANY